MNSNEHSKKLSKKEKVKYSLIALITFAIFAGVISNTIHSKNVAEKKSHAAYEKNMREERSKETKLEVQKALNEIKLFIKLNSYSDALNSYDNNLHLLTSDYLDKNLQKEYESLYDEIIYGIFFVEYKEVTNDAEAFYESHVGNEYTDYYYGIEEELLSKELQTQLENTVSVAAHAISAYKAERLKLARQENAQLYIGLSESLVRSELGSPTRIEAAGGFIPEDRRTAKETWYYTYNGELTMYFVIGLNGTVLDAYQYQ